MSEIQYDLARRGRKMVAGAFSFVSKLTDEEAAQRTLGRSDFDSESTTAFAHDLSRKFGKYDLSSNQRAWMHYFANREDQRQKLPNLKKVVAIMYVAKIRGLKRPIVRIMSSDGEIKLSIASERSRNPGTVNVVLRGTWCGRIEKTGELKLYRENEAIVPALQSFMDNPEEAALSYARETGACCFCGRELTRNDSIGLGYGPICADKYGLPHPYHTETNE